MPTQPWPPCAVHTLEQFSVMTQEGWSLPSRTGLFLPSLSLCLSLPWSSIPWPCQWEPNLFVISRDNLFLSHAFALIYLLFFAFF